MRFLFDVEPQPSTANLILQPPTLSSNRYRRHLWFLFLSFASGFNAFPFRRWAQRFETNAWQKMRDKERSTLLHKLLYSRRVMGMRAIAEDRPHESQLLCGVQ